MKHAIAGALLVAVAAVPTVAMSADDKPVTITGCLLKGEKRGYVLTKVTEISGAGMPQRVIYWLSGAKNLGDHVGHRIEVRGTITPVEGGEVEVQPEKTGAMVAPPGGETSIQVEARGREIEAMTTDPAKVPVGGTHDAGDNERKIKMPAYKLKVKDLRMVSETCP